MDYYANAHGNERAAITLLKNGHYQQCVSLSCLAVELYLKSKLHLVQHSEELMFSHDVVNIYKRLITRFQPKTDILPFVTVSRKYFNESRYPYAGDTSIYTQEFANEFIEIVAAVREFIDNECVATMDDLRSKHERAVRN